MTTDLSYYDEVVQLENGLERIYVRKERFEELESLLDSVCKGHSAFVNKVHDGVKAKCGSKSM